MAHNQQANVESLSLCWGHPNLKPSWRNMGLLPRWKHPIMPFWRKTQQSATKQRIICQGNKRFSHIVKLPSPDRTRALALCQRECRPNLTIPTLSWAVSRIHPFSLDQSAADDTHITSQTGHNCKQNQSSSGSLSHPQTSPKHNRLSTAKGQPQAILARNGHLFLCGGSPA